MSEQEDWEVFNITQPPSIAYCRQVLRIRGFLVLILEDGLMTYFFPQSDLDYSGDEENLPDHLYYSGVTRSGRSARMFIDPSENEFTLEISRSA